jgi:hypothetical protein
VELRFVAPTLRALDERPAEVVACAIHADERPMRGLAGLLDWRLGGRVSRLAKQRFVSGADGEVLCTPGRPHVPFDKVLFVGAGPRESFDEAACARVVGAMARALEGLRCKRAVVELPGRASNKVPAQRAAEIALEATRASETLDAWYLVESAEAQATIKVRTSDEGRRPRG